MPGRHPRTREGLYSAMKRLIVTGDDFGFTLAVNEAVERAARDEILTCASLMVGAAALRKIV